jgi:hypothetical protein
MYPWKGIIANIKTEQKDGKHIAESGTNSGKSCLGMGLIL